MRRLSRDTWLGLSLIVLLVAVLAAGAAQSLERNYPPFSSRSADPDGARALALWLNALKLTTLNASGEVFSVPANADVVFVLEPALTITEAEWDVLEAWIAEGGTLVLAGHRSRAQQAFDHLGFEVIVTEHSGNVTRPEPLSFVPEDRLPELDTRLAFGAAPVDHRNHVAMDGQPVVVSFKRGEGTVVLSTASAPFTNRFLEQPGNAALALAAIHAGAQPTVVWFDEWHHGIRSQAVGTGPGAWLRSSAPGRALLVGAGVLFLAIALSGRAFGRPVRARRTLLRRAPLEHITAMANLSRRAGHRGAVQAAYARQLKRQLGQRYRVNPTLPDEAFVQELARYRTGLDVEALGDLLDRLARPTKNEGALLALANDVVTWLERR